MADITQDLSDDGFHEIQLSGKQLVFLFMVTTVVSVVIFLLGVLVGRDVRGGQPTGAAEAALTTPAPAPTPTSTLVTRQAAAEPATPPAEPPSPPAEDELTYRKRLESENAPAEKLKAQVPPARTETPKAAPEPAPAKAAAAAVSGSARPGRWVVQLVALRDRGAASSIVQRLSGKGYPAFMVNPAASTPNQVFKVQIGRYDDRGEAERVARRLEKEEKFNPWISR